MLQHPEELRKMNLVATERHKATTEVQEQMKSADFETGDAIAKLKGASNSAHDTSGGDDISAVKKERRSSWGRGEKSFRKSGDADDAARDEDFVAHGQQQGRHQQQGPAPHPCCCSGARRRACRGAARPAAAGRATRSS